MLQFVARKPINRSKADEALSQLSSKAFQLLYGKRALDICQQPQKSMFRTIGARNMGLMQGSEK